MRDLNKDDKMNPASSVTNFKDIKSYIKTHPEEGKALHKGALGQMSLQDLKGHMEADWVRFEDIHKEALWKKEWEMADELQVMKKEKDALYSKKQNDE